MATDEITKYPLRDALDCIDEAHSILCYITSGTPDELICESGHHGFVLVTQLARERLQMAKKCVEKAREGES